MALFTATTTNIRGTTDSKFPISFFSSSKESGRSFVHYLCITKQFAQDRLDIRFPREQSNPNRLIYFGIMAGR